MHVIHTVPFFPIKSVCFIYGKTKQEAAGDAEGLVFESQPRQTEVVNTCTCSDSFTAKRHAVGVSVVGPQR